MDPPVLLNAADLELVSPTCTLPKLRLVGLAPRTPGADVPVPDKDTVRLGFVASLVTVRLPLALLADGGAKVTLNDLLVPAANVKGRLRPLMLKPVPLTVA